MARLRFALDLRAHTEAGQQRKNTKRSHAGGPEKVPGLRHVVMKNDDTAAHQCAC
jgi:hypothetical protein